MDVPPDGTIFQARIERFYIERFSTAILAMRVLLKVLQAVLLCMFWVNIGKYEETIFDFQALLFITDLYRTTLDLKNSVFLFCLILFVIYIVFTTKSFFPSVIAMIVPSILLEPVDMFYWPMLLKSFCDVLAFILSGTNVLLLRTHMSSRCTDFVWLLCIAYNQLTYIINLERNSVADLLLVPIFMLHIVVFSWRRYTRTFFRYTVEVTLLWMYWKSSTYPRRINLLDANAVLESE